MKHVEASDWLMIFLIISWFFGAYAVMQWQDNVWSGLAAFVFFFLLTKK